MHPCQNPSACLWKIIPNLTNGMMNMSISPAVTVTTNTGEWQGQLLSFRTPELGKFQAVGKKAAYYICVKGFEFCSLAAMKVSRCAKSFGPDSSPNCCQRALYMDNGQLTSSEGSSMGLQLQADIWFT